MLNHYGVEQYSDLHDYTHSDYVAYWNQLRNTRNFRDVPAPESTFIEPAVWKSEDIVALKGLLHKRVVFPPEIMGMYTSCIQIS